MRTHFVISRIYEFRRKTKEKRKKKEEETIGIRVTYESLWILWDERPCNYAYFLCDSRGQIIFTKRRLSNPSSRELYFERFIRKHVFASIVFSWPQANSERSWCYLSSGMRDRNFRKFMARAFVRSGLRISVRKSFRRRKWKRINSRWESVFY